jgi:hypothetical protein
MNLKSSDIHHYGFYICGEGQQPTVSEEPDKGLYGINHGREKYCVLCPTTFKVQETFFDNLPRKFSHPMKLQNAVFCAKKLCSCRFGAATLSITTFATIINEM